MEIRTGEKLGTLLPAFTFLCLISGVLAELQLPQTNVEVIQGQMVVLRATYTGGDISEATVIWNMADKSEMIISYINGVVDHGTWYNGRSGFVHTMPNNNLSIYINNTVESDSGRYMCQVILPGSPGSPKELTVNVKVPPAMPVCTLQGQPVLRANVTLSCHSSAGKPAPKYKWAKTSPSSEVFFSPMLNETVGTLKLNNLSSNMSGKYECTSSNSAGEGKCYINLEVITSTNAGVIAGATVGAVVGFVLIVLFIIFLWTRRRDTEEDLANDIKEDAQAPKRVSWAKSGTGSDIVSKNGTLSSINSSPHLRDTHNHYQHHYSHSHPTSDTASIITATGSTAGFRPRPVAPSATPEHTLPGYNTDPTLPRQPLAPPSSNGGSLPRTEAAQPQMPRPPPLPTGVSIANISRMGGVPIMVPAQNQAGSLV
ncbi:endothelial cell adhesion molecule a [Salminus brasiliensis]|uniref:endothelial cell adhesion molecule a n=1 Tax=Salminus brasiliensis TaxID=930266 RepID=UPI003B832530